MYFKLIWKNSSGEELTYDIQDADEMLLECEKHGYDTSEWLGKANAFVERRGVNPSYAYFLVNSEVAEKANTVVGTINPYNGAVGVSTGSYRFDVHVEYDDIHPTETFNGKPVYKSKTYERMYVQSCVNITPSLDGKTSFWLLTLVDARSGIAGSFLGTAQPTSWNKYGKKYINKVESYLTPEELRGTYKVPDAHPINTGAFAYEKDSVQNHDGTVNTRVLNPSAPDTSKIEEALTWKQVIETILIEAGGGIHSAPIGQPAKSFYPAQDGDDELEIIDDGMVYPPFDAQDIYIGPDADIAATLTKILFTLGADLIWEGRGTFRLCKIKDTHEVPSSEDFNVFEFPMQFDTDLLKWTYNENNPPAEHFNYLEDKKFHPVIDRDGDVPSLIKMHTNYMQSEVPFGEEDAFETLYYLLFSEKMQSTPPPALKRVGSALRQVESPFVWTSNRGDISSQDFSESTIPQAAASFPVGESLKDIEKWFRDLFCPGKYNLFWQYPTKTFRFSGFRSIPLRVEGEDGVRIERISWFMLGGENCGTIVENQLPLPWDKLKPRKFEREPIYVSIVEGRVDKVGANFISLKDIVSIAGNVPSLPSGKSLDDFISFDKIVDLGFLTPQEAEDALLNGGLFVANPDKIPYVENEKVIAGFGGYKESRNNTKSSNAYSIINSPPHYLVVKNSSSIEPYIGPMPVDDDGKILEDLEVEAEDFDFNGNPGVLEFDGQEGWTFYNMRNISAKLRGYPNWGAGKVFGAALEWVNSDGGSIDLDDPDIINQINQIINNYNVTNPPQGTTPFKVYKAEVTATKTANEPVPFNSTTEIIGGTPPGTGSALNRFNSPFLVGEKVLILEKVGDISPTIVKIQPNIIKAEVSTSIDNTAATFNFSNANRILGPIPNGASGSSLNNLKIALDAGTEVILTLNENAQWIVTTPPPAYGVVKGKATIGTPGATFSLTNVTVVSGKDPGLATITVQNTSPAIRTNNSQVDVYAVYDPKAGTTINNRWTAAHPANIKYIMAGLSYTNHDYSNTLDQVYMHNGNNHGWIRLLQINLQIDVT